MTAVDAPVALVTGSSSGIGAAIARRLATEGYRVVVNSMRSAERGAALAAELPDAIYVKADVTEAADADRLVGAAVDRWGRLDVLVNNAGTTEVIPHSDLTAATADVWRRLYDVNVIGAWQVTVAAMPHLRASGAGAIVNITSLAGSRPRGSSIPYAVSKAALDHLTRLLAEVAGPQVRVNAVAPGLIDTDWTAGWTEIREQVRAVAPLRRSGTPDDVAAAVVGVLRSPYQSGTIVPVDGGLHLRW